jgi:hypothetical protein
MGCYRYLVFVTYGVSLTVCFVAIYCTTVVVIVDAMAENTKMKLM